MTSRVLAGVVGMVLAYAGAAKVVSWSSWRSRVPTARMRTPVSVAVPSTELLLGGWLVGFDPSPLSLGLATLLLVVFTVYLSARVLSGSQAPCACFGATGSRPPAWRDVARNVAMIAALFAAAAVS